MAFFFSYFLLNHISFQIQKYLESFPLLPNPFLLFPLLLFGKLSSAPVSTLLDPYATIQRLLRELSKEACAEMQRCRHVFHQSVLPESKGWDGGVVWACTWCKRPSATGHWNYKDECGRQWLHHLTSQHSDLQKWDKSQILSLMKIFVWPSTPEGTESSCTNVLTSTSELNTSKKSSTVCLKVK